MKLKAVVGYLLFIATFPPLIGQEPALRIYGLDDGLKFPQVFSLHQDAYGFIWAGTSYGAGRYDGRSFINLTTADGLPHNSVRGFAEDDQGLLWIMTQEGPATLKPGGGREGVPLPVPLPGPAQDLAGQRIEAMAGSDGTVWFLTESGRLFRWLNGNLEPIPIPKIPPQARLIPLGSETLLVAAEGIRLRIEAGRIEPVALPEEIGNPLGAAVGRDRILIIGSRGAALQTGASMSLDTRWAFPPDFEPDGVRAAGDQAVLFSARDGAVLLQTGSFPHHIDHHSGLPARGVTDALIDREGLVWLATENGLVKVIDWQLRTWRSQAGGLGPMILSIAREPKGPLWIGHGSGISRLDDSGNFVHLEANVPAGGVWGLLVLRPGVLLAATPSGPALVKDNRITAVPLLGGFEGPRVFDLMRDPEGRVWAATMEGVIRFRWDHVNDRPADVERIFPADIGDPKGLEARAISRAGDGTVWIGTDGQGVVALSPDAIRIYGIEDGLPSLVCRAVLARPDGVWIGTEKGLWIFENGRAREVEAVNRLLSDPYIVALTEDAGDVWVAGTEQILRARNTHDAAVVLDRFRGFAGTSTTAENCLLAEPGLLWIGTVNGLTAIDTTRPESPILIPRTRLVAVEDLTGRRIAMNSRVPFPSRTLTFSFFSPTYLDEESLVFSWRLLGHDPSWSTPRRDWSAQYTNLYPGRYTFEVRSAFSDGGEAGPPDRIRFTVAFPWGPAVLAMTGVIGLAGLAAWGLSGIRTRRIRRRNLALERLVADRTSQLAAANRRLERLAVMDGLTGLANRRHFESHLRSEWMRAQREGTPISLLMIDIDLFKAYNDALGHLEGDDCLRRVARAIAGAAERPGDLAARFGGEEFAVILPGTERDGALEVAGRIRETMAGMGLPHPASTVAGNVTLSIGVAEARPVPGMTENDLVAAADNALYRAKKEGRNRIAAMS